MDLDLPAVPISTCPSHPCKRWHGRMAGQDGEGGFVKKKRRSRAVNAKSFKKLKGVARGLSLAEAGRRAGYAHPSRPSGPTKD
jgi:hypothetical protein